MNQGKLFRKSVFAMGFVMVTGMVNAGYVQYGSGMKVIITGSVENAALNVQTTNTWRNTATALPYTTQVDFALPHCDAVVNARLFMTVWGATRDYRYALTVCVNGITNPATPMIIGGTGDSNSVFVASNACAYGTGSGVWLVTVPIPPSTLFTNGTPNNVSVTAAYGDGPSYDDGRIIHLTLMTVYQKGSLFNQFSYAMAEGSGDIYKNQAGATNSVSTAWGSLNINDSLSARLYALYTYGDSNQNDRLYFNGIQYGSDDVANKQNNYTALIYVPDLVSFTVTNLLSTNVVRFSVSTNEIPGTCETSLRPQAVALGITREPVFTVRNFSLSESGAATFDWIATTARTYSVQASTNLLFANGWNTLEGYSDISGTNGLMHFAATFTNAGTVFFRLLKQ
ncbi:MAG: hypothetical protein WCI20_05120 [bacterium]